MKEVPFTLMTGVNTLFNALAHADGFDECDFSRFKFAIGGGMAIQEKVAKRWEAITKRPLIEGYGLTEASPVVSAMPVVMSNHNGSIGYPLPSTEIKITDDDGSAVAEGEVGELCVRGPQVMQGYWRHADETGKVLSHDGWLKTGDLAMMSDDGFIYIVDRKKDMILVSGFNVYPNEVEDVIMQLPAVKEVAVVGVQDEAHGEVVKAVIVKADPSLTREQIDAHCHEHLTGYKTPDIIEFVDDIPKNTVGKVLRRHLRGA
jgi:long-chain acyl-CoA synthetase